MKSKKHGIFFYFSVELFVFFYLYIENLYVASAYHSPSDFYLINWEHILLELFKDLSFFDHIETGSTLLVSVVKSNIDDFLQINNITDILIKYFSKNFKEYNIVQVEQLNSMYRSLGSDIGKYTSSYSFFIKIANYLKADYIIYGIVSGNIEQPILELQLVSVRTGEIITTINNSQ